VIDARRAAARYETVQPGITTRHCFSSAAHYDPANTAFGPLIAVDEHMVAPGAGFGRHAHRGVEIVSWVLAGTLRHEDTAGRVELVAPGMALLQSAGSGIEHIERNASDTEHLRFVQLVLLGAAAASDYLLDRPPLAVAGGEFTVLVPAEALELAAAPFVHAYVTRGIVYIAGQELTMGDSVRIRDAAVIVEGGGEVILWRSTAPAARPDR
jgi:redox-sensitive bicupin YhaK (pirin superfamily)